MYVKDPAGFSKYFLYAFSRKNAAKTPQKRRKNITKTSQKHHKNITKTSQEQHIRITRFLYADCAG
jgi:hypothetical protein